MTTALGHANPIVLCRALIVSRSHVDYFFLSQLHTSGNVNAPAQVSYMYNNICNIFTPQIKGSNCGTQLTGVPQFAVVHNDPCGWNEYLHHSKLTKAKFCHQQLECNYILLLLHSICRFTMYF